MSQSTPSEQFAFRAEIKQLLDILVHSLYTEREIFLRELVSNASDALNRVQFELLGDAAVQDPEAELAIRIYGDPLEHTLIVRDTGSGMTHDELVENLGTIAHSGARAFMDSLATGQRPVDMIGQFGVGFYSVFMVADEVRVTSRSYRPGEAAWTWIARGAESFEIVPGERAERGTTVWVKLKDEATEFGDPRRLEAIVHRHADFVSQPIYVGDRIVNRQTALWRQAPAMVADDVANAFYRELTLDPQPPLARIHLHADAPVQLYALLFIPADAQRQVLSPRHDFGLQLYVRKVLIQAYCKDLLPHYLRFVEGVVDSEDIPLNVSRELVQSSEVLQRIRAALTRKVLDTIREMAATEPEKYSRFWAELGPYLKEGIITEPGARDKLLPLLRCHSSRTTATGPTSLADYVARMPAGQTEIYYVLGQDLASAAASPHLDPFRARGLEVLLLVDPLDAFMMPGLTEFDGHALRNVDDPDLALPEITAAAEETGDAAGAELAAALPAADFAALAARCRSILGPAVVDVRVTDRLVDSPLRLVAPAAAFDHEMDRLRRLLERDYAVPPRVVELNPRHPLIHDLARLITTGEQAATVAACITQLYENGLLLEGLHPNPAQMVGRIQALMAAAVARPVSGPGSAPPAAQPVEQAGTEQLGDDVGEAP